MAVDAQNIHQRFQQAVQQAVLRVVGGQDIFDLAQLRVMTALLQAYGDSQDGILYAEPALLDAHIPPPDIVLVHPATGVFVIECKAYDLDYIEGMEAGNLRIRRHGQLTTVNPLRQSQRGMFAIKDVFESLAAPGIRPLFHALVALPNIRLTDWEHMGYHQCIDSRVILFADHLEDLARLKKQIEQLVHQTMQRTRWETPFPVGARRGLSRVFGDSAVINEARHTMRQLEPGTMGARIEELLSRYYQISGEQQYLSRVDTWGYPYLVRGVAGSGKSIVLANMVARTIYRHQKMHDQLTLFEVERHALPRLGVICFNRTLVPLLKERIARAYHALTGKALPEDIVQVIDLNRLLYQFQEKAGSERFHYIPASDKNAGQRARRYLNQLENLAQHHPELLESLLFDGIFVDEGQDAHPEEYMLLHRLIRPDRKTGDRTLTIFYDDAQNIYGRPPPVWHNLSINMAGGRAELMEHCYRNSQEILELGFNVLLGTRADSNTRVATRRFADVHTLQEKKLVEQTAAGWRVKFATASGIQPIVHGFSSRADQLDWVAESVVALIEEEQVAPEHILLLAPRANGFRHLASRINQLISKKVPVRMVGGLFREHLDELLVKPGHLTLATVYAAKGYDAPVVFLMDVDYFPTNAPGRAQFYTGVTRARRYLIVTGIERDRTLMREALDVQQALRPLEQEN